MAVHIVNDLTNYWLFKMVFWRWYKKVLNALLSLFRTAYHSSVSVFPQPQLPTLVSHKVDKLECPLLSVTLNIQLRHICQPQTWSHQDSQAQCIRDSLLPFGAAPPGFQPGLVEWRNRLSTIPPTFPFTVCKPWPSVRGMVLVTLTAEYQECLKVGPFDVRY